MYISWESKKPPLVFLSCLILKKATTKAKSEVCSFQLKKKPAFESKLTNADVY